MTQELYQKAMMFAGEKHANQRVPGATANYLVHISNVTMEVLVAYQFQKNFDIDFAIQVAILHDTLEDTDTSLDELEDLFGARIATAVEALTKKDNFSTKREKMLDSLHRVNQLEKEVGLVKLADRITNLQKPPVHWPPEKIANYLAEAKIIAKSLVSKNDYLQQRLSEKIRAYGRFV